MGIVRGTFLALMGIGGWLIERYISLISQFLIGVNSSVGFEVITIPPSVHWGIGCMLGIVAGDIFTVLVGEDVSLGKWAGIWKGIIASSIGILSLYFSDGFLWFVASIWISTVIGDMIGL